MIKTSKRVMVYFDPDIYRVLKLKAIETSRSISDLVNDAVRHELGEDEQDLKSFKDRAKEPTISYKKMLKDLKTSGKI